MTYYGAKELAASFATVRKNTIQAAEEIPESQYGFKAAESTRTIEKMLTHLALAVQLQYQIQAVEKRTTLVGFDFPSFFAKIIAEEAKPRTKAEVIALLRESGDQWTKFLEGLSEDFLAQSVEMPQQATPPARSRLEMILSAKEHEMHHRAQIFLMQRMIGIVPHLTREFEARMAQVRTAQNP
jgi:uncharacterized damage-inducible protein DinB